MEKVEKMENENIKIIKQQIHDRLAEILNGCYEPILVESMFYSVFGGGKRLRPLLLIGACEAACGEYSYEALDFACALELIHCYSLVHDDLPAMDNDDLRHGKPTNHKQFNEAIAILTGDALLNTAFEVMANLCTRMTITNNFGLATATIAKAAGNNGMIAGQMQDILGTATTIETLTQMQYKKTGRLFSAALSAGAMLGKASESYVRQMGILGETIGNAFQILDDILDVIATEEQLGKPINSDIRNKKITYVTLKGLQAAKLDYAEISQQITDQLNNIPQKTSTLNNIVTQIINRTF
ncbi:MAG: polyprenyl synthetase family protein [Firmicutes bacterium]|nr:polyprenyl synthetase family protein [Bacillota bacterium]